MSEAKKVAAKPKTKTEIIQILGEATGLEKKVVVGFLDELYNIVKAELTKGPGVVVIPGIVKIKATHKPATKERKAISPLTKQEITYKAKPARTAVKAAPVKTLKDAVA